MPTTSTDGLGTPITSQELVRRADAVGVDAAAPVADEVDRDARFPVEAMDALREARLLSALVPVQLGGAGGSVQDVASVTESLGRHCSSTALIYAMHQIQVACLVRHGDSPWLQAYLRAVAAEELLLASATTEIGVGGDVRSSVCALEPTPTGFRLQKHAPVISYGDHADAILATARRTPESTPNDQVLVVLPRADASLEQQSGWDTLGFRGTCSNGFLLTAEGDTEQVLTSAYADISAQTMLPTSHILWASAWLGMADAAVARAAAVVRKEARSKPGVLPPSAMRLAELTGVHEQLRSLVHHAAVDYDSALALDDVDQLTSMGTAIRMNALKTSASTLLVDIVGRALVVCGMSGYRNDSSSSLGRLLRDAHGAQLMINNDRILGANAQMLLVHKGDR